MKRFSSTTAAAVAAALVVASIALADFVVDNTTLPATKTNLRPLPGGADPTKYIQASDYNALSSACYDLRTAAVNGKYQGFAEQASDPLPGNATNYLYAKNDHTIHYKSNGVDTALGAGGGGTLQQAYDASGGAVPSILETNAHKGVYIKAANVEAAPTLEVTDNAGQDRFYVDSLGSHVASGYLETHGGIQPDADGASFNGLGTTSKGFGHGPHVRKDAIGAGNDETALWKNTTAAAAGVPQNSPGLVVQHNAWDTGSVSSKTIKWMMQAQGQETNPVSGYLAFLDSINGGSYALMAVLGSAGDFSALGDIGGARVRCLGATPSIAAGAGAGGAMATVSVAGTDCSGLITVTTAIGTSANATIVTITFTKAFNAAPGVTVVAANDNAGAYNFNAWYYVTSTASSFDVVAGTHAALTGVTQYKWFYTVIGN